MEEVFEFVIKIFKVKMYMSVFKGDIDEVVYEYCKFYNDYYISF